MNIDEKKIIEIILKEKYLSKEDLEEALEKSKKKAVITLGLSFAK